MKVNLTVNVRRHIRCTYVGIILPQELAGQSHSVKEPTTVLRVISLPQHRSATRVFHINVLAVVVEPVSCHGATTNNSTTCSHSNVNQIMLPLSEVADVSALYPCTAYFQRGLEKRNFLREKKECSNFSNFYSADANQSVHFSSQSQRDVGSLFRLKYLVFSLALGVVGDQLLFGVIRNGFEIPGTCCPSTQAEHQEERHHWSEQTKRAQVFTMHVQPPKCVIYAGSTINTSESHNLRHWMRPTHQKN